MYRFPIFRVAKRKILSWFLSLFSFRCLTFGQMGLWSNGDVHSSDLGAFKHRVWKRSPSEVCCSNKLVHQNHRLWSLRETSTIASPCCSSLLHTSLPAVSTSWTANISIVPSAGPSSVPELLMWRNQGCRTFDKRRQHGGRGLWRSARLSVFHPASQGYLRELCSLVRSLWSALTGPYEAQLISWTWTFRLDTFNKLLSTYFFRFSHPPSIPSLLSSPVYPRCAPLYICRNKASWYSRQDLTRFQGVLKYLSWVQEFVWLVELSWLQRRVLNSTHVKRRCSHVCEFLLTSPTNFSRPHWTRWQLCLCVKCRRQMSPRKTQKLSGGSKMFRGVSARESEVAESDEFDSVTEEIRRWSSLPED